MSVTVFNPRINDAAVTETTADAPAITALNEASSAQAPVEKAVTKKVFVTTQGCQMNVYDSDKMLDVLGDSHGMEVTHDIDEADVLLMNTCSIREKAQEKVFSELGRWRKLKEKRPDLVIGVGGCVASQEGDNIQKRAPYVDMVFGPQTLHRLPDLYDQSNEQREIAPKNRIGTIDVSFPSIEKFDFLPEPRVEGYKAFVSIMEGCSKYCSFCVVPYTRGEELSRPLDDVLSEIDSLAAQGIREINLLGQNVNGYRGEKDAYAQLPELVSHLHLPVQRGSNAILAAMKRNHTIDVYINQINKLKAIRPDIHLSSDFIIGFPGETDQDFQDTLNLAKELNFDHSYSFIYSKRPGTPAAELPDDVSFTTKKARLAEFQKVIIDSTLAKTHEMVGTTTRVLVEQIANRHPDCLIGTADNTRTVMFPYDVKQMEEMLGKLVSVRITDFVSPHMVKGELIEILA